MPQFAEHGGIDRRREGSRKQRQNAILAGKIERRRIAALVPDRRATKVPAPSTRPASVEANDRLSGRCSRSTRNACSKRSM
jgi:hypothetical protein